MYEAATCKPKRNRAPRPSASLGKRWWDWLGQRQVVLRASSRQDDIKSATQDLAQQKTRTWASSIALNTWGNGKHWQFLHLLQCTEAFKIFLLHAFQSRNFSKICTFYKVHADAGVHFSSVAGEEGSSKATINQPRPPLLAYSNSDRVLGGSRWQPEESRLPF